MKEIENGSNFEMLYTTCENEERLKYQKEENNKNNKFEDYFDFDKYYLKYIANSKLSVKKIKIGIEFIFFICQSVKRKVTKASYTQTSYKNKIFIKDKNLNNQGEIEIKPNSQVDYIGEIKEKNNEIIICLDNKLYKLSKTYNQLEFIYSMNINHILQINENEYIISNNSGTFKYEGSILKITKENLEIKEKKITDDKCKFGVFINLIICTLTSFF